ncbi:MAG: bifunctional 5,10-methylene-tetrahydrofolate dehydrogenase/5,10-methylene-tetrahydrofolate cyclohydrolase [Deltaproteobacteria bacterium RIFCSPLOWO2_02_FULL_44_10]|nr:MAG: bifunctional 5,10-methylene-tetrahydrofolate dehydrogenase/5,10-methylene-tetrahydrofolate cyclohydrolase [Deltaproteobacteria bacterium RIFCSPLOWO2_02_FULL_44_10]
MTQILDGKKIAADIQKEVASEVRKLKKRGMTPGLAVILVGENAASQVYVKNKRRACEATGIQSFAFDLPEKTSERELLTLIEKLNRDPHVHGILIQLPLPKHIDENKILMSIDPNKDVDGFHPVNAGKMLIGQEGLRPCTPSGIIHLLDCAKIDLKGKHAVVIGRSNIVGKPTGVMLLVDRHATVTICHSLTKNLRDHIAMADVIVIAIGQPGFLKGDWLKRGAVVIDVGINRTEEGKLVGDVDFETAKKRAGAITPVPGGVGPMTIAMLLQNVVKAAKMTIDYEP